ncbi:MAG: hypothetical protein ACRDHD_02315 [Candidatus Limnocylindria bacterium]
MPVPVLRYALTAALAVVALVAVMLLVRPFIFSFAAPRDDANYPVVAALEADAAPRRVEILLNDPHGLLGEVERDDRAGLTVVVARQPGVDGYSAVSAWSPTHDCPVTIAGDRLADCDGDAWTFAGVPIDPGDPPLQRFPTAERNGAVIVDFTAPLPAT